jgi:hypothetical protein
MIRLGSAILATCAAALTLAFASGATADEADPPVRYVVKPGDNLFTLGRDYLLRPQDYRLVQQTNHVADPRRLKVGSTLLFEASLLKSRPTEAHITAFSGQVRVIGPARTAGASIGMGVGEGQTVTTGPGAFVTFELADESRITLPSNSTVRIVRLREVLLTEAVMRVFALDQGRSDISAAHSGNPNSRFQVRTPLSVSAVRGTEFRVSLDGAANRAATEVIEGGVGVAPPQTDAETLVPQNFGVAATPSGVSGLVALLAPPQLVRGGRDQQDPDVAFKAEPLAGAAAYRLQLANDAGFVDIFAEAQSEGGVLIFKTVPNGTYFARVTAIDPGGIEGLPNTYSFQRDLDTLDAGAGPKGETVGKTRRFLFRWSASGDGVRTYRFQLFAGEAQTRPLIDLPGLSEPQVSVTDLPPGTYSWRVLAIRFKDGRFTEKVGAPQILRIGE